jgi:leader peptidase (prepilin peptidase)/N-methyltransferase
MQAFTDPTWLPWLALLFGLLVGSFLNVVIHRLPAMLTRDWRGQALLLMEEWAAEQEAPAQAREVGQSLAPLREHLRSQSRRSYNLFVPRSACPSCGRPIRAWENIPVLSWLALRGRCAGCKARISLRYPLVEAFTGVVFAFAAWRFGFSWTTLGALIFCGFLIAGSMIDFDTKLLPDDLTLPLLWLGLLFNLASVFAPFRDLRPIGLPAALIGAVAGYLVLRAIYEAFKFATGKEGMGFGDFKLLAAIGAWFGWQSLLPVVLVSAGVGSVIGVSLILFWKHARENPIPFGPYLALGAMIYLFWGKPINAYLYSAWL